MLENIAVRLAKIPLLKRLWRLAKRVTYAPLLALHLGFEAISSLSLRWRMAQFDARGRDGGLMLSHHSQENYLVNGSDEVIGRSLFSYGQFDLEKLEQALEILKRDHGRPRFETLIDVGANVGCICIPAVKRGWIPQAIAIEPEQQNYRLLRMNLILNDVEEQTVVHRVALGAGEGNGRVRKSLDNHGDHRVDPLPEAAATAAEHTVRITTLDTLLGDFDYSQSLLWMDVQGYEGFVLTGAGRALAQRVPMVLEFSPRELKEVDAFELLLDLLLTSRYELFYDLGQPSPQPTPLTRDALQRVADDLLTKDWFTDLLFA